MLDFENKSSFVRLEIIAFLFDANCTLDQTSCVYPVVHSREPLAKERLPQSITFLFTCLQVWVPENSPILRSLQAVNKNRIGGPGDGDEDEQEQEKPPPTIDLNVSEKSDQGKSGLGNLSFCVDTIHKM